MKTTFHRRGARSATLLAGAGFLLGACTVMPTGPSVMALPGSSKSVGQYQVDVADCRQYAGAVVAASGDGTAAAGNSYTAMSSYQLQRGYDSAYLQCMYARGNRIPMPRGYGGGPSRPTYENAPETGYPPPANVPPSSYPPPNTPPPSGLPPRS